MNSPKFQLYSLKNLMEDFYLSEISSTFSIDVDKINYHNNQEIFIDGMKIESHFQEKNFRKKDIFKRAEDRVLKYLQTFRCSINSDVENFLHDREKCIRMHKSSTARTYFILDSENEKIAAFFALSIKPILLEKNHSVSNNKKKKLPIHTKSKGVIEIITTFLIGQIGRSDTYTKKDISLYEILDYIFAVINIVKEYIGGKVVLVEVANEPKLISLYSKFGFEKIQVQNDLTQLMQYMNYY